LDYDGYGKTKQETNPSAGDRYLYTARQYDSETGLYNGRARYYDPYIGRWTSQDPIGFQAGDSNLYRYVANRSMAQVDPSGLMPTTEGRLALAPGGSPLAQQVVRPQDALNQLVVMPKSQPPL